MTEPGRSSGSGPSVCPFVALAEDRDRRADGPDEGNRCYAERAPRQRDMVYQADYCYSERFATCSVFLGWAARNAAEPAYVSEAASRAWSSGIAAPGEESVAEPDAAHPDDALPTPTPEGGLFGPADPEAGTPGASQQMDWVSASAWADAPWDERAESEADELEAVSQEEEPAETEDSDDAERPDEATQAPKVPAALPVRRRKKPQPVIRSRGSGEWFYADPPGHEPLVSRRTGVAPPIALAVLGLLVAALIVFMIPTLLFGGGSDDPGTAAAPSPSTIPTVRPRVTPPPVVVTPEPTEAASPSPTPRPATHKVRRGDTLTSIAQKYGVKPAHIVCLNDMRDRDIVMLGVEYDIPPEGFRCPPNWRNRD